MKLKLTAVLAALVASIFAASASALIGGAPDGQGHPYVAMMAYFPTGNPADGFELCSGVLVSPTVYVTAAHCFPGGGQTGFAVVDNDPNALADLHRPGFGNGVPAASVTLDPNFHLGGNGLVHGDANDIAVVQLAGPIVLARYASLPARGYDDTLPNNQKIDNVAYGVQAAGVNASAGSRQVLQQKIVPGGGATGAMFLKLSAGAVCNGDSGGPNLQAGTNIALALNSYGPSATCNAVSYSQRLDTADAVAFLAPFLK
jgi:hypothetical protein